MEYGVLGSLEVPMALGLLRLSVQGRPDEMEAIAVIHRALDRGIRVLDTADTYGRDDRDLHYGEHLVRKALNSWNGPANEVRVITKVDWPVPKDAVAPHEAAVATLWDLEDPVIPVVGATRPESLDSSVRALALSLDDEDRTLRQKISFEPTPQALKAIQPLAPSTDLRPLQAGQPPGLEPEVVLIMGIQGAGKSSRVEAYQAAGYSRLNRDILGGKLDDLLPKLEALLSGQNRSKPATPGCNGLLRSKFRSAFVGRRFLSDRRSSL